MSEKPPIEFATVKRDGAEAFRSLAERTGLPVERIAELASRHELLALFSPQTGRLRPATEIRNLEAAGRLQVNPPPTPQQRLAELFRYPPRGPHV